MEHETTDIVLVGAGPAGLEMAVALKHAGMNYVHLEAGQIGATMAWWPPGTRWFSSNNRISIAGVPLITPEQEKATREEYLAYLRMVVLQFGLAIRLYEPVRAAEKSADGFLLTTERNGVKRKILARRVILATGGTAVARKLNVPGEELPHVSHFMGDPHMYFQQRMLIVGGRNGAVEAALRCHKAGARVTMSYRGAAMDGKDIKYWLWPEFSDLVKTGQIALHCLTEVERIAGEAVTLKCSSGERLNVAADFVLMQVGYLADMALCKMLGVTLEVERQVPVFNVETMQTDVPGVFVCGTATAGTQGRYRVFLENCHVHIPRIMATLKGERAAVDAPMPARQEE